MLLLVVCSFLLWNHCGGRINYETNSNEQRQRPRVRRGIPMQNAGWFQKYNTLDEINLALDHLEATYRNVVTIESIGSTHEGRPIRLVKVSTGATGRHQKPGIWIDGGIHPSEWISPATVLFMLNRLLTGHYPNLLHGADWYFVPVLNPDGYAYTHKQDRFWRKNRRPAPESQPDCGGVNLNRNFGYDFGGADASDDPCEDDFQGPQAFSEPESQAVRDFVQHHKDIQAFVTLHSYGQHWYYPYGNKLNSYPEDVQELADLARKGARALQAVYQTSYEVGTAAALLYESSGGSDDWAKGKAGIKWVYTLELRPADTNQSYYKAMSLPRQYIVPTGLETWVGLRVVFEEVIRRGQTDRKRKREGKRK